MGTALNVEQPPVGARHQAATWKSDHVVIARRLEEIAGRSPSPPRQAGGRLPTPQLGDLASFVRTAKVGKRTSAEDSK